MLPRKTTILADDLVLGSGSIADFQLTYSLPSLAGSYFRCLGMDVLRRAERLGCP